MNIIPPNTASGICLQLDTEAASLALWSGNNEIIMALRHEDIDALANGFDLARGGHVAAVYLSGTKASVVCMQPDGRLSHYPT